MMPVTLSGGQGALPAASAPPLGSPTPSGDVFAALLSAGAGLPVAAGNVAPAQPLDEPLPGVADLIAKPDDLLALLTAAPSDVSDREPRPPVVSTAPVPVPVLQPVTEALPAIVSIPEARNTVVPVNAQMPAAPVLSRLRASVAAIASADGEANDLPPVLRSVVIPMPAPDNVEATKPAPTSETQPSAAAIVDSFRRSGLRAPASVPPTPDAPDMPLTRTDGTGAVGIAEPGSPFETEAAAGSDLLVASGSPEVERVTPDDEQIAVAAAPAGAVAPDAAAVSITVAPLPVVSPPVAPQADAVARQAAPERQAPAPVRNVIVGNPTVFARRDAEVAVETAEIAKPAHAAGTSDAASPTPPVAVSIAPGAARSSTFIDKTITAPAPIPAPPLPSPDMPAPAAGSVAAVATAASAQRAGYRPEPGLRASPGGADGGNDRVRSTEMRGVIAPGAEPTVAPVPTAGTERVALVAFPIADARESTPTEAGNAAEPQQSPVLPTGDTARPARIAPDASLDLTSRRWVAQLADHVAEMIGRDGSARVALSPERLGPLVIALTDTGDGLSLRLEVATEAAQDALQRVETRLLADVRAAGGRIADSEVVLAADAGAGSGQSLAGGQQGGQRAAPPPPDLPAADRSVRHELPTDDTTDPADTAARYA